MRHRICGAVLVVLILLATGAARAQPGNTISSVEYLRRLAIAAAQARAAVPDPSTPKMDRVRQVVGLPLKVELRKRTVSIDKDPFLDRLAGRSGRDFERAARHLDRVAEATQAAIAASPPDSDQVRKAVEEAYRGAEIRIGPLERIAAAISNFLAEILSVPFRLLEGGPGGLLGVAIVVVALGFLAVFLVRRIRIVPERRLEEMRNRAEAATDWDRVAREALERGDIVEATRARFRALLQALADRGVVEAIPSLTAAEAKAQTRQGLPSVYSLVSDATTIFERVAYGESAPARAELDTIRRAEEAVRAA